MGFSPSHPAILAAIQKGLIAPEVVREVQRGEVLAGAPVAKVVRPKREKPALVEASFTFPALWVVPLHVTAGDNNRGKGKIGRAGHERRAVSRALGGATLRHLAVFALLASQGETVTVTLTRLGGGTLDDDNCVAAMKYCRDSVAMMLGFDDNARSPLRFVVAQEPGGACGVRIQLTTGGAT